MRFTLVELMIVVAIIGILAAIAIPNFHRMQLKAKQAEVFVCVDGIMSAARAYEASSGNWIGTDYRPMSDTGKSARPWDGSGAGWTELGWAPDGAVRGSYQASAMAMNSGVCVLAVTNLDGDAVHQLYDRCTDGSTGNSYTYPMNGLWLKEVPNDVF